MSDVWWIKFHLGTILSKRESILCEVMIFRYNESTGNASASGVRIKLMIFTRKVQPLTFDFLLHYLQKISNLHFFALFDSSHHITQSRKRHYFVKKRGKGGKNTFWGILLFLMSIWNSFLCQFYNSDQQHLNPCSFHFFSFKI